MAITAAADTIEATTHTDPAPPVILRAGRAGRLHTNKQAAGLAAQKRDLKAAGCEKIFAEQVSSVANRAKLTTALEFVREGDVLVVTKQRLVVRRKHI